jgi:hypothetical protein
MNMKAQELESMLRSVMVQVTDGYQSEDKVTIGRSENLFVCATRGKQTDFLALYHIREFLIKNGFAVNNIEIFSQGRKDEFSVRIMAEYIGGKIDE